MVLIVTCSTSDALAGNELRFDALMASFEVLICAAHCFRVLCSAAFLRVFKHCTVQHSTVQHSTVLYFASLCCAAM
jgi:hypothetical protein